MIGGETLYPCQYGHAEIKRFVYLAGYGLFQGVNETILQGSKTRG